jgi:hypothetical protein
MTNPCLAAGLGYAARGWRVFPVWWVANERCACRKPDCQHPGKHPLWHPDDLPSGRNSANTSPELIKHWWRRWPKANVGIATGFKSGLLVVDVDPRNGGHQDRLAARLPNTPTVFTGGEGWHYYLSHPGKGIKFPAKLPGFDGVDLKADGGYVVAPPSIHISGRRYSWQTSPDTPLAPCPQWLIEVGRRPDLLPSPPPSASHPTPVGTPYGRAALRSELDRLNQTPEGYRNNALNRAAFSLGKLVAAGHLDKDTVISLLTTVAQGTGLPMREVERTLLSGMSAGVGRACHV